MLCYAVAEVGRLVVVVAEGLLVLREGSLMPGLALAKLSQIVREVSQTVVHSTGTI